MNTQRSDLGQWQSRPWTSKGRRSSLISIIGALAAFAIGLMCFSSIASAKVLKLTVGDQDLRQPAAVSSMLSKGTTTEFVVQFKSPVGLRQESFLQSLGFQVHSYLPEDAFVVSGDATNISVLESHPEIHAVAPMNVAWKLDPTVSSQLAAQPFLAEQDLIVDLVFFNASFAQKFTQQRPGLEPEGRFVRLRTTANEVRDLVHVKGLEGITMANPVEMMNVTMNEKDVDAAAGPGDYSDLDGFETGTRLLSVERAWGSGFKGKSQAVAIADTGLDRGTEATVSSDFQGAVVKGYNFGVGATNWADPMGHGTHVAGSVGGRGTESKGILVGAAPEVGMVPQGMWSPLLENLTVPPQLNKLFAAATESKAPIHTNSWGSPANLGVYDRMAIQVDEYAFNNQELLIVFAAGNSGVDKNKDGIIDRGSVSTPGTAKNALTVGASENLTATGGIQRKIGELRSGAENWGAEPIASSKMSDNENGIACFSSRGPTRDGRIKPDIVAPGTNILSNKSQEKGALDLWGAYNSHYVWSGGTSMATPLAAGAAAVVREILQTKAGVATPSAALVKAAMLHTAKDLFPGQYGVGAKQEIQSRPDMNQGYGRVDVGRVLDVLPATKWVQASVGTGELWSETFQVAPGQKLTATMVYTDAPGAVNSGAALVNDLDLRANGQGPGDRLNNHETLTVTQVGSVRLEVSGERVPRGLQGKQPFALAITIQ